MGEQCGERYARPRSRLASNTRRFLGGIPAEKEKEGRKAEKGIPEMQIKGKFSATRANLRFCVLRFWGLPWLRVVVGERQKRRMTRNRVRKLEMCVREEKLYSSMEVDDRLERGGNCI